MNHVIEMNEITSIKREKASVVWPARLSGWGSSYRQSANEGKGEFLCIKKICFT